MGKRGMKNRKVLLGFILLPILASCELKPFEDELKVVSPEETTICEESALFTKDSKNKTFIFETNDTKYLNKNGYTLWTNKKSNNSDSFDTISVKLSKESGRKEAGFGIVFCSQKLAGKLFMLSVLINSNGLYTVGKVVDGVFSDINQGWKNSNYINKGYGIKNELLVSYDNDNKNFLLKINGYEVTRFTVSEELVFKNSKSGFVVVIANNENFPRTSVRVLYEQKK